MSEMKDFDDFMAEVAARLSEGPARGEYEFWEGPDILEEIRTGEIPLGEILLAAERREMRVLISGVIGLLVRRHVGDEEAHLQLSILHTFIFPKQYEVPEQVIRSLAKKYRSGALARAWALRRLMYRLSELVVPVKTDARDILDGPVKLSPRADKRHPLYEQVVTHLMRRTTLQMLAIRIYGQSMFDASESGNVGDYERSLKRDLQRLREWEKDRGHPSHERMKNQLSAEGSGMSWKAQIPVRKYSESWVPVPPEDSEADRGRAGALAPRAAKKSPKKPPRKG